MHKGPLGKPENALVEQKEVDRLEAPAKKPKDVWSIPTKLQVEERARDLTMFDPAIDSKLRDYDWSA
jgi:hypothetical protein